MWYNLKGNKLSENQDNKDVKDNKTTNLTLNKEMISVMKHLLTYVNQYQCVEEPVRLECKIENW